MIVTQLEFDGFRNLETGMITPDPGVNIFYGDNAQGKTNLLEATWLLQAARAFAAAGILRPFVLGRKGQGLGLNLLLSAAASARKSKYKSAEKHGSAEYRLSRRQSWRAIFVRWSSFPHTCL